ncbi:MAG: asparaginyl/glutamyl-tRNA amidotransferase subunit C [Candidatus Levybacteria bacterium RIFCSPHIGHO2_12_FULL_37_9]|nr:MAG: asparaginyl/glutamyl-tRNA amidotransferase subunit C [Candidatus Levybacteria bacterium RIFCSPHIGHO2_12_FULL_37_9]
MKIDVGHIAKLANLEIKESEKEKFQKQLSSVLQYVDKLQEVDTKDVEATSQVTGLENVTREDETKPSLTQEEALSNSKSTHNGFFKVKAILDE